MKVRCIRGYYDPKDGKVLEKGRIYKVICRVETGEVLFGLARVPISTPSYVLDYGDNRPRWPYIWDCDRFEIVADLCCNEMRLAIEHDRVLDLGGVIALGNSTAIWKFCPWCATSLEARR